MSLFPHQTYCQYHTLGIAKRPNLHLLFSHIHSVIFQNSLVRIRSGPRSLGCVARDCVAAAVDRGERQRPGLFSERWVNLASDPDPQGQHQPHDHSRQPTLQSEHSCRHWASGCVKLVTGNVTQENVSGEQKVQWEYVCISTHYWICRAE